jgi:hypothetical protein
VGGTTVTPDSVTATAITFRVPAGTAGAADVVVTANEVATREVGAYMYGTVATLPGGKPTGGTGGAPAPLPGACPSGAPAGTAPVPLPSSRP